VFTVGMGRSVVIVHQFKSRTAFSAVTTELSAWGGQAVREASGRSEFDQYRAIPRVSIIVTDAPVSTTR
jgi:hypothetical protein